MPRVSVIIPTFNRAALLPRAVESALAAGRDTEVIVVDDASTDETPRVCAGLRGIRYLRLERNLGVAGARNAGVLESSAELVTALGDDDVRLPGSLDAQVRLLEASPEAAFCYGPVLLADARRHLPTGALMPADGCPTGDIFWELLEGNFVPDLAVVARKRLLVEQNLFDTGLPLVEDWDMWLRLTERYPVVAVEEPVAIYRFPDPASGQLTSDSFGMLRQTLRVQKSISALPRPRGAPKSWRRARRRLLDKAYKALLFEAGNALAEGERAAAREKLRAAFRLRPLRAALGGPLLRLLTL